MFINRIFRESALRRRSRPEPLDDRLQITAPHEWLIVAGLAAFILAAVGYGLFWRIDRTASFQATVVAPGERHYVDSPVSGSVLQVEVGIGDHVVRGQAIARVLTSPAQYDESSILAIVEALDQNGLLMDNNRAETLQALLAANSAAGEAASVVEVVAPHEGEVVAVALVDGQSVAWGDPVALIRAETAGKEEVLALISSRDASRLRAGMDVEVSARSPGQEDPLTLAGRILSVSARMDTPPRWLVDNSPNIPERPHVLSVELLDTDSGPPIADGTAASLRVVLGSSSFASLLTQGS
jgi:multidrug resistance efflux pump